MDTRKKKFQSFLILSGVVLFIALIIGFALARSGGFFETRKELGYPAFGSLADGQAHKVTDVLKCAFTKFLLPHTWFGGRMKWAYLLLPLAAALLFILSEFSKYDRDKDVAENAKGGQKWNDIKKYNKRFSYPKHSVDSIELTEIEEEPIGNFILSKHVRYNGNIRDTYLNNNVLIIGAPGSGKSRNVLKPNILQYNCSYIVTDPAGELLRDTGEGLERHGYMVKSFDLSSLETSMFYNPFHYIRKNEDIPELISCFIKNTTDKTKSGGDEFFTKAEQQLYTAIFYYIHYYLPPEQQNFRTVIDMVHKAEVSGQKKAESELDKMFFAVRDKGKRRDGSYYLDPQGKRYPYKALIEGDGEGEHSTAVSNYEGFKVGSDKTLQSILISANVRLQPFTVPAVAHITSKDTLKLDELGDRPVALFICTPTGLDAYNFLAGMLYTQMFQLLYYKGSNINPHSWLLKCGKAAPLRSRMFVGGPTGEDALKAKAELEAEQARYEGATIEGPFEGDVSLSGERPKYYLIKSKDGEILQGEDKSIHQHEQAEKFLNWVHNGKIKQGGESHTSHIRMMLDEFANVCEIPDFINRLTTMRKFSISCTIIVQAIGQLKKMYKDDYESLMGSCSCQVMLGSSAQGDLEYYSKQMGNSTVKVKNTSESHGGKGGGSVSLNQDSRELMKVSEIRTMDTEKCLVIVSAQDPFQDEKYNVDEHANAKFLAGNSHSTVNPYDPALYFSSSVKVDQTPEQAAEDDAQEINVLNSAGHGLPRTTSARAPLGDRENRPRRTPERYSRFVQGRLVQKGVDPSLFGGGPSVPTSGSAPVPEPQPEIDLGFGAVPIPDDFGDSLIGDAMDGMYGQAPETPAPASGRTLTADEAAHVAGLFGEIRSNKVRKAAEDAVDETGDVFDADELGF